MSKLRVAIVGLGNRGKDTYAKCVEKFSDKMEIVAIADIDNSKVEEVKNLYAIPSDMCFKSAEELLERERLADCIFLCTQDKQHVRQAVVALKKGYHLLLEKPISPDLEECREIVEVARQEKREVVVCHVLRYTPFYRKIKSLLDSGIIGKIMSIQAIENVGYFHQAHSFVRGNWCNSDVTSPMVLQKCCHDMDIFLWLCGKKPLYVSSFGSLSYFKKENAPQGATGRCMDGCKAKDTCPYDAEKIYLTNKGTGIIAGQYGWPNNVLALHPSVESITEAIQAGPYGRCVFDCDNNVVDHQVINIELEDDITVNFTMCGFTKDCSRQIRVMGTLGEIFGDMHANTITVTSFGQESKVIDVSKLASDFSGHGGGDVEMVKEFMELLTLGKRHEGITSLDVSVESHFVALAAEASRLQHGKCMKIDDLR